jgi:hypothetical protein
MNSSGKVVIACFVVILAMGGAFGAYYLNTTSLLARQEQTISGLQSKVESLVSQPITSMLTSTTTQVVTTISVTTATTVVTQSVTRVLNVPFDYPAFMVPPDGHGAGISFASSVSDAIVFSCPSGATQGCTVQVDGRYNVTAFYPQVGQANEPAWANCSFSAHSLPFGEPLPGGQGFGYCVVVGSNSFIIAEPFSPV